MRPRGLSTTQFVIWWIVATIVAEGLAALSVLPLLGVTLPKVLLVAALEGILVGTAQSVILRRRPGGLDRIWLVPTVLGAILGRTFEFESDVSSVAAAIVDWSLAAHWVIGMAVGAAVGSVLALPQAVAMRTRVRAAWRWVPMRAVAWGLALPLLLVIGAVWSHAAPGSSPWFATALIFGLMLGLVGLIEGWGMARLTGASVVETFSSSRHDCKLSSSEVDEPGRP